ncbi:VOC family protein [Sinorhizobium garamanticum]|uniref:VOC family protein n=1 Tax=Sinorhizobium garamanticum TaxID=680247 RepID=A0ABY8D9F3_9HYPH|nr:VOC family protein [Sinorhizobium garamanticum]WEX86312.1 VOC family protein [Sinorhizobium garamanticum]
MVNRVRPFLMFQGEAEAAMNLYLSLFSGAKIISIDRYGPGEAGAEGSVMQAQLSIAGETILCIDSPVKHEFDFRPAFSLFVDCDSESELEHLASALAEGGAVLMPLANYGFSRQFAWVCDRYGVSWQLNLR